MGTYDFLFGIPHFQVTATIFDCLALPGLCPRSRARHACTPRLPRFALLGNFSDTLLVVSILDMVYGCYL